MWKVVTVCLLLIGLVQSNKRQFPQSPTYPSAVSFADRVDFYDNVDVPVPYYNKILDPRLVPYPYVTNHGYGINHRGYAIHPPFASGYNYVIQNKYDAPNINKNMNNLENREYIPRINGQGPENILNSDRFPKINFNRGDGQTSSRKDMLN
ncbi:uncharacterized protein LOC109604142 isoform X1 [Aethina tumida]|uniref:uncharacterized protein LOC109604142 isoform X1 n=1 Tax=Aethina tumida TaxID=116153 RepID=UPI0021490311|nr:uncharacterized protein LOC109604142 isoform X1 [Aethina tumida]